MRLKRVFGATITLLADDHINYILTKKPWSSKNKVYFAYIDSDEIKEALEKAIRKNKEVDMLIERKLKGKEFDYVIEVTARYYETPDERQMLLGDKE